MSKNFFQHLKEKIIKCSDFCGFKKISIYLSYEKVTEEKKIHLKFLFSYVIEK